MTVSRSRAGTSPPYSHETTVLSTLRRPEFRLAEARHAPFRAKASGICVRGALARARKRAGLNCNLASGLLNSRNSVYRRRCQRRLRNSISAAFQLLGRRQVVRQWILIPPCGGSNPPAPARQSRFYKISFCGPERPAKRGLFSSPKLSGD